MCGIAGARCSDSHALIRKMTDVLGHRGPDAEGFLYDEAIALGFRRLSIIDLETGDQPITNETGTLHLICNGEIYNSPELRRQLKAAGHTFKTRSDVEVILHLYEDYGRNCVRHLRGMFAFAIWDSANNSLLLARDHLGQKPLFFYQNGDKFLFASEVKALLASGVIQPEIDLDGLWHYISLRFIPDRYSLFKGIQKLPAATSLLLEDGRVDLASYWTPDFRDKRPADLASIEDELDALLVETVRMHRLSDVRVGAFLSGGIDSSMVAAILAQASNEPVPTFSIGVEDQGFNELPFARLVAERYGLENHERIVKADLVHLIPSMVYHMDEPSDPFGIGVYLVSKVASESVKVVLGGDGGDENFAGYDRYASQRIVDLYALLPRWFRRKLMRRLVKRIPESYSYKSTAQKATWLNEMSLFRGAGRYAQSLSFLRFTDEAKQKLFSEVSRKLITDQDSEAKIAAFFDAETVEQAVDRMLYTDLMTRIPDHLLVINDRMSMAHSLESRSPLIDHKVVEFAASIPAELKLRGSDLKYLLKKVAARYLPPQLIRRKKQGFSFPLGRWMRTDLRQLLEQVFNESRFVERGIFNRAYIEDLLQQHVAGKADHNYRLWILLNLEIWHRLFFENETPDSMRSYLESLMARPTAALDRPISKRN